MIDIKTLYGIILTNFQVSNMAQLRAGKRGKGIEFLISELSGSKANCRFSYGGFMRIRIRRHNKKVWGKPLIFWNIL
jgi:hypothetical protein